MSGPRMLGVTWGDPFSAFTYSGVPWHLFAELDRRSLLVQRANAKRVRPTDVFRGALDVKRTLRARRPRRNALWRYMPANIELLSDRFAATHRDQPPHDAVVQFGVAGIPRDSALVAHVEIPVEVAASSPMFSRSFGFEGFDDRTIDRAIVGEREFLQACSIVWTNSPWTAAALESTGCPAEKIRWYPPGCGAQDPGEMEHAWDSCSILFVGKSWEHKGGPQLIEAFRHVRVRHPKARLTIIGCDPPIDEPGVSVLGYLSKDDPGDAAILHETFRQASLFCMPSLWESTGIVFMEAALYGLPIVMVAGQGREELFPPGSAIVLEDRLPDRLATAIAGLADDPQRMMDMGAAGRQHVLHHYMWPTVADHVVGFVNEATGGGMTAGTDHQRTHG